MHSVEAGDHAALRAREGQEADLAALCCAALAMAFGAAELTAWVLGIEGLLANIRPEAVHPGVAGGTVMAGASLFLVGLRRSRAGFAFALAVFCMGMTLLVDFALKDDAGAMAEMVGKAGHGHRPSPNTIVTLLLTGLSLMLLHRRARRARIAAQLLATWTTLIGMFLLVGYGLDLVHLRPNVPYLPMLRTTALAFAALGIGTLVLTRDSGLAALVSDKGPGGTMFRVALPVTIAIPFLVGVLRTVGERHGLFPGYVGVWLQIMTNVVLVSTILTVSALALYRSDLVRRQNELALRSSERFNRLVAAANPDCISLLAHDYTVCFVNEAVLAVHGLPDPSELIGKPFGSRLYRAAQAEVQVALRQASVSGTGRFTMDYPAPDGRTRWFDTIVSRLPMDEDTPLRFLAISRDITEKREIEDKVRWKATHDDLTRLPNRAQFQMHLDSYVRQAGQQGFALLTLDIDNFKSVNDTLGHDAGDHLLRTVADRLSRAMRQGDVVARLAGDEFAVIACGVRTEAGVMVIAERIFESLREPWLHHGRLGECRISIGASIAPRQGDTADELFKHADIALYEAKSRGKGQIAVFRPSMKSAVQRRSRQIELARHALNHDFVVPYYQPKVHLQTGRVAGFEALLRWRHPTQGVQLPGTIQAAFEDLELAGEITQRMLDQVLRDMRRWHDRGLPFGHVAINVTAADLRQDAFPERLIASLAAHSLPHDCLQVEITETVFMGRGAEYVERALGVLHEAGIRVALDDFGTGYASLSHLKQFPVDIVKIDRSFLHDFALDPQNQAIINTVISLGHSLEIEIVAEGIESAEQERHLLARGCTYGQGYLYSKAIPAVRVPRLVTMPQAELRPAA